ncbi:MAG: glycosyltransferase family 4 protein [Planctomycetota bacterium]|nr:glycosyltransferase family 4 protein [Planctomycetota bacterium]
MTTEKPLRILHLTAGSDPGGLSRYLLDLCGAMHAAGHDVTIAGQRGPWHDRFAAAPWPWIDVPLNGGPLGLWRSRQILRTHLAQHPVDLIHAHYRKSTLVARQLQRTCKPPVLYTLHLSHMPVTGIWRLLTDYGDHTHAAATDARQWLIDDCKLPPAHITLIPHGIDPNHFPRVEAQTRSAARRALGLLDGDLVALFIGRMDEVKNVPWMLDLAADSRSALPNLRILLAGEGPDAADLQQRITDQGLANRVKMLGHREPLPLYHAADALLLPSRREGFSLVCAEAMCAGIPVLRTRTSGTADLIIEGVTGRSTPIKKDAFIQGAISFLADPKALAAMGIQGAEQIRKNFTFERQVQETVAMYRIMTGQTGT